MSGAEAERIGLLSMAVDDDALVATAFEVAGKLAHGSQSAIRWTQYALNDWLRMARPTFDASLASEAQRHACPKHTVTRSDRKEHRYGGMIGTGCKAIQLWARSREAW